jgi:hypothetical protein
MIHSSKSACIVVADNLIAWYGRARTIIQDERHIGVKNLV